MTQEQLRMQMLAGIITESQYKEKLKKLLLKLTQSPESSDFDADEYMGKDFPKGEYNPDDSTTWGDFDADEYMGKDFPKGEYNPDDSSTW